MLAAAFALFSRVRVSLAPMLLGSSLVAAQLAAAGPRDPLLLWTDAAGAVRYTTELRRIPSDRRAAATRVEVARDDRSTGSAPAPAAQPAPAGAPSDGAGVPPSVETAPPAAAAAGRATELDKRIAELEGAIAADEAAVGNYISDPDRSREQAASDEMAAIAERLPRLHEELRELRKQREAATAPDGR